jgi:hypothetical protein
MLDEIFELFERDKRRASNTGGGLRARLARAIGGHNDDRRRYEDDRPRRDHDDDDDDDDHRYDKRRRRREFELFGDDD